MILECQQHQDYMRAVQTLLDLAEQYGSHGKRMTNDATGTAKESRSNLANAETSLKVRRVMTSIITTDPGTTADSF